MKEIFLTPDLSGKTFINDREKAHDNFFYYGHHYFLIPGFQDSEPSDIYLLFTDYLVENHGEIYDQNGNEFLEFEFIDNDKIKAKFVFYDIEFNDYKMINDFEVVFEGYIVDCDEPYFITTKITYDPSVLIKK